MSMGRKDDTPAARPGSARRGGAMRGGSRRSQVYCVYLTRSLAACVLSVFLKLCLRHRRIVLSARGITDRIGTNAPGQPALRSVDIC